MHLRRTFATLLTFALSLQLLLAGKGHTCVGLETGDERADGAMQAAAMRDMGDMGDMGKMGKMGKMGMARPLRTADEGDNRQSSPAEPTRPFGGAPCDRASASTACQLFASCAAGFVAAGAVDVSVPQEGPARLRVPNVASLLSRTIAPEFPPPRA